MKKSELTQKMLDDAFKIYRDVTRSHRPKAKLDDVLLGLEKRGSYEYVSGSDAPISASSNIGSEGVIGTGKAPLLSASSNIGSEGVIGAGKAPLWSSKLVIKEVGGEIIFEFVVNEKMAPAFVEFGKKNKADFENRVKELGF